MHSLGSTAAFLISARPNSSDILKAVNCNDDREGKERIQSCFVGTKEGEREGGESDGEREERRVRDVAGKRE